MSLGGHLLLQLTVVHLNYFFLKFLNKDDIIKRFKNKIREIFMFIKYYHDSWKKFIIENEERINEI